MGQRIACICGKKNRVQHARMAYLAAFYLPYLDVFHQDQKVDLSDYDVVYYSHFSLYKKHKFKGTKIASVTSHKYTKKELEKFNGISVNNKILLKELKRFNPVLTENGVNTNFWTFKDKKMGKPRIVGWVGNKDRKVKRYDRVKDLIKRNPQFKWKIVATSKHDKSDKLKTPEEMKEYYQSLDVLIVLSKSEGTPNPALEAMSCGTPVASAMVGNMPDIEIVMNGWMSFVDPIFPSRQEVRKEIEKWDWSIKYKQWDKFFRRYL